MNDKDLSKMFKCQDILFKIIVGLLIFIGILQILKIYCILLNIK